MGEFLEERLPIAVRMGASYADEYNVEITQTAGGSEYRHLVHGYPVRIYNIFYTQVTAELWDQILALYHRAYGMYAGFRVKAVDDYTTNGRFLTPTAVDQVLGLVSEGVYQLQVAYGGSGTPLSIGKPVRSIFKPVSGTVMIAIGSTVVPITTMWTVSNTTGIVTFNANKTKVITGISNAANAVVSFGSAHTFLSGESVHFTGVLGMTGINGLRGTILSITSDTITVNINTLPPGTYSGGGTVNTRPQSGEIVYGGCEFDIPCRFNSRIDVKSLSKHVRETSEIEIIELLNP